MKSILVLFCGQWENDCVCPECPVCSSFGDPECYEKHGLVRTQQQIELSAKAEAQWKADADAENDAWDEYFKDQGELTI